jgi:hypothetical protein
VTRRHYLALLLALGTGCRGVATTVVRPATQSFPGFDVSIYPGDAAMRAWVRPNSPYHWVGYYLPAPCHRDASWGGKRETLAAMGWGLALLYVGQQTWEGVPDRPPAPDTTAAGAAAQRNIVCSRTLLTAAQGLAEADDAIAKASADGFPRGTRIFLDIERMTTIPQGMRDYYRAWVARLLADGRYRPAIYAHQRNAAEIYADVRAQFDAAGVREEPSFWVSSPGTATLVSSPSDVGFQFARVWQHTLDVSQTFNSVTLRRIDANLADSPSPSAPGPDVASTGSGEPRTP